MTVKTIPAATLVLDFSFYPPTPKAETVYAKLGRKMAEFGVDFALPFGRTWERMQETIDERTTNDGSI